MNTPAQKFTQLLSLLEVARALCDELADSEIQENAYFAQCASGEAVSPSGIRGRYNALYSAAEDARQHVRTCQNIRASLDKEIVRFCRTVSVSSIRQRQRLKVEVPVRDSKRRFPGR